MTVLAALALSLGGFAALALSQGKHRRDLLQARPARPRSLALRTAGWILLSLSLGVCMDGLGVSVGIVFWTGLLTVAALAVTVASSWRDARWRRRRGRALRRG